MKRFVFVVMWLIVLLCAPKPMYAQEGASRRAQPRKGKGVIVIRARRMFDATSGATINNPVVVVTDNRITAVGERSGVRVPSGARVIDLGDATLLPGLIDAHTHIIGLSLIHI